MARIFRLTSLGGLLATAPEPLHQQVCSQRKTLKGRVAVCTRLRPLPPAWTTRYKRQAGQRAAA